MEPCIQLMHYCILEKDSQRAKFSFRLAGFSLVESHCISPRFWFAGNYWKLQITKRDSDFGMYLRWYGTGHVRPEGDDMRIRCVASLLFSVVNVLYPDDSISLGDKHKRDVFDRDKLGIGFRQLVTLEELHQTAGYVIEDSLYLQVQIKVYETAYRDVLWCIPVTEHGTSEGTEFSFYGTTWKLIFYPHGESQAGEVSNQTEENKVESTEDANGNADDSNHSSASQGHVSDVVSDDDGDVKSVNKSNEQEIDESDQGDNSESKFQFTDSENGDNRPPASIYLMRCDDNAKLRYNVIFRLLVDGPRREIILNQHFFHEGSNAYGVRTFLWRSTIDTLKKIKVTVTFEEVVPYCFFGYRLNGNKQEDADDGFTFHDHFSQPWSFLLRPTESEIAATISLDPEKESKKVRTMMRRRKYLQVCWMAELLSGSNIDKSVLFATESQRNMKDVVLSNRWRQDSVPFRITLPQLNPGGELTDESGMLNVRLSIYCCNFVLYERGQLSLSFDSLEKIANEIRQNTPLPQSITPAMTEDSDVLIQSLVDHLHSYESYITKLEKDYKKAKAIRPYESISSLIHNCRPSESEYKYLSRVATTLEQVIAKLPFEFEKVLNVGALDQGIMVKNNLELEVVVYLKDFKKQKNRVKVILKAMEERIEECTCKSADDESDVTNMSSLPHADEFSINDTQLSIKMVGGIKATITISQGFEKFKNCKEIYDKASQANRRRLRKYILQMSYLKLAFISIQPVKCKDLICVVQNWSNNITWKSPEKKPSSYLLTLLVIYSFKIVKQLNISRTPSFDKEVLITFGACVSNRKLRIEWDNYYSAEEYGHTFKKNRPFIRDPAIPFHNVAESGIYDWTQFRRETRAWVESLTF